MNQPRAVAAKTYFVKPGENELGPLTLPQINRMRSRGELAADTPCRTHDSPAYLPLATHFPHLGEHTRKSPEEHRRAARVLEGNGLANTALVCGALSWVIATPILSIFAVVLGAKSYLFAQRMAGLGGAMLGVLAFMIWLARILKFIPES